MAGASESFSVLFVCLGNICRSPAAEGVLQDLVDDQGFESQIKVDSAGTAGYHVGKLADERMRKFASRRGIDLTSRSRKLVASDLHNFDLVIAMDRENLEDIQRLDSNPTANVKMLSDYLSDDWPDDVPDPYYGGDQGFEIVLDMLQEACPKILEEAMGEN